MRSGHARKTAAALFAALLLTAALTAALLPREDDAPAALAPASFSRAAPLCINDATAEELECLPGVGPALAAAIIERRETAGPFACEADLLAVPGVGEATLAGISPYITC